jgi:subtilisin family serine protease
MKKVDSRLRVLARRPEAGSVFTGAAEEAPPAPARVEALMRCDAAADVPALAAAGIEVRSIVAGAAATVLSVAGAVEDFERLESANWPWVRRIEASRRMLSELDISCHDVGASTLHERVPPIRGTGVIVGLIDAGIDFTHPNFRTPDGRSRIVHLWDQNAPNVPGSAVKFGREYSQAELDAALAHADPLTLINHRDVAAHGTHVAGIAAGSETDSGGSRSGVAPEADLIVVSLKADTVTIGRSVPAFDALAYIVNRSAGRPVAINISQGMNGGGHVGETALETAIETLVRRPGVVIVKSAGNEQQFQIHASGQIATGQTVDLQLEVQSNDVDSDVIEVWTAGSDRIDVAVQPPGGTTSEFVAPDGELSVPTAAGNHIDIRSDTDADDTGDTAATIILSRASADFIQPGTWLIRLRGAEIVDGRFDAWIERADRNIAGEQTRFVGALHDPSRTITIPGTAKSVITVGSFVTRPNSTSAPRGSISSFSSVGPNRYGLRKPEIVAPGEFIVSARSSHTFRKGEPDALHLSLHGTSMAAPHVAGAAALLLSIRPTLRCSEVKQLLMRSARRTGGAASAPDDTWGAGMLDIAAALELAGTAMFPAITNVTIEGAVIRWTTDIPTTGAVRFHTHKRQLQLGRSAGSRAVLVAGTDHAVDLGELPSGRYFCEVVAFSSENWSTTDDRNGELHLVVTP